MKTMRLYVVWVVALVEAVVAVELLVVAVVLAEVLVDVDVFVLVDELAFGWSVFHLASTSLNLMVMFTMPSVSGVSVSAAPSCVAVTPVVLAQMNCSVPEQSKLLVEGPVTVSATCTALSTYTSIHDVDPSATVYVKVNLVGATSVTCCLASLELSSP